jgi:hypothetical protein
MSADREPDDAPAGLYGPDGRPQFFSDPAMDRFVPVVLNLASELWLQNEAVANLKALLAKQGILTDEALDQIARDSATDQTREAALREFIVRVLGPLREMA